MEDLSVSLPFGGGTNRDPDIIHKIPTELETLAEQSMVDFVSHLDSLPDDAARKAYLEGLIDETVNGNLYEELKGPENVQ